MKIKLHLRTYSLYSTATLKLRYSYDNFITTKLYAWMLFNCVKIDLNAKLYDSKSFQNLWSQMLYLLTRGLDLYVVTEQLVFNTGRK